MESLGRVVAVELMSISGNIAKAIYGVIRDPKGMEHGKGTIRWLSCASCCL